MYSTYDLHSHSLMSDGALSPADLLARAKAHGVEVFALTDHDTLAGQDEAFNAAESLGVRQISGIELSCVWQGRGIHIVGLNFELKHSEILAAQQHQHNARMKRSELIGEKLIKVAGEGLFEHAVSLTQSGVPGRPHFAQALIERGVVDNQNDAFKKYLGSGKKGDVKLVWPDLEVAVRWIVESGGVAVIAHPRKYDMTMTKLRALIDDFKVAGGQGIEVVVSGQKQGEAGMLGDLCNRSGLYASIGSDFHAPAMRWADVGRVPKLSNSVKPIWELWE